MKLISELMVYLHIICGFTALLLFWIPALVKKGSPLHKKVGLWYVYAMSIVAGTAFILSVENLFTNRMTMGLFLGFLSLLTARPLWLGIACLKDKDTLTRRYKYLHASTSLVISLAGVGLVFYGLNTNNSLSTVIIIFGVLGITAIPETYSLLTSDFAKSKKWLEDHIVNMCVAGIAAHTAFLVFGGQSLLPNYQNQIISIIMWTSPSVIGFLAIAIAKRKYLKKKKHPVATVKAEQVSS